jgi:hypothetical protein
LLVRSSCFLAGARDGQVALIVLTHVVVLSNLNSANNLSGSDKWNGSQLVIQSENNQSVRFDRRAIGLFVIAVILLGACFWLEPIPQSQEYHNFADQRALAGIPNIADVLSNIPFILVGWLGLAYCRKARLLDATRSWKLFFIGVALVGPGSAYYHLAPNDATLVWDRLPMTVAFMALFAALMTEYIDSRIERWLLIPLVGFGAASVLYWYVFDDLRLYFWVQLLPLVSILYLMIVYRRRNDHQLFLWASLILYGLAKTTELLDSAMFSITNEILSGHTLKHLLAALATYCILLMLRKQRPARSAVLG